MTVQYTLRVPDDLYAKVKAAAEQDQRSIHGEILWLLTRALEDKPSAHRPGTHR